MEILPHAASAHERSLKNVGFRYIAYLGLGLAVFLACVLGTLSRPAGSLASLWFANAVMLGALLRYPHLAQSPWGWIGGALAFILSGPLMGDPLPHALWLSAANMAGVVAGWLFFSRLHRNTLLMREELSALYLLCGSTLAALAATVAGCAIGPLLFNKPLLPLAYMWFTSELMNYMLVLPVMLSAPLQWRRRLASSMDEKVMADLPVLPALTVLVAELFGSLLGGPGALLFSVPALLWCALRYSLFTTSLLCLMVCVFNATTISQNMQAAAPGHLTDLVSLRIGLTLLSLGPLAVACALAARDELLKRLDYAANHDSLTGALSRGAFISLGQMLLADNAEDPTGIAVLMLDLDHFKAINDAHGHAGGDAILRGFTRVVQDTLRSHDLFGRLGGEEFSVLLPRSGRAHALSVAQRLCDITRDTEFVLPCGKRIHITVSVGVVHVGGLSTPPSIDRLLQEADLALYEAKTGGRDRIVLHALTPR
jgi:diguanylate cyclase (GGDEF)-like protein